MQLSSLYDGDKRLTSPVHRAAARNVAIPHPIHGATYAEGENKCTHAGLCPWPARKDFR